ncbi:PIN domain-containing protein [Kitasatospora sp. NPDC048365]|uniref:PIN domain-containing protein n=1 Tax=Kitasatospora sp. NPDC048365 TaxID=3364050 RepID=UPI0037117D41
MHLTLRPGTDRDHLLVTLSRVHEKVSNLYTSGPHTAFERLISYLEWADEAAGLLAPLLAPKDVDSLVFTRRYEQIFGKLEVLASPDLVRLANGMLNIELRQRTEDLAIAVASLSQAIRFRVQPTLNVVFDTSMFFRHPEKLELLSFRDVTKVFDGTLNLMVPIAVIDELDRLKDSRDRHVRWRAGHTLGVLDGLFRSGVSSAVYRQPDFSETAAGGLPHPKVTVEVLVDPPGHVRLPDTDDEIIDRALAVQPIAASPVKLFTYDTGQALRARHAGLAVKKLALPQEDEPAADKKP